PGQGHHGSAAPQLPWSRRGIGVTVAADEPAAGMDRFLDEGIHVLPQARAALVDDRPDVLLGDIGSYPARVLAHQWSRPFVHLSPTYIAWESYEQDMADV